MTDTIETLKGAFSHAPSEKALALFAGHVEIQPNGCWLWTASKLRGGYGIFGGGPKTRTSHRVAFEWANGWIPDGKARATCLDHTCRNRACVNPVHLEVVSTGENVKRGVGVTASNARKTHCKRGHEFTPENTIRTPRGRHCRICSRQLHRGDIVVGPDAHRHAKHMSRYGHRDWIVWWTADYDREKEAGQIWGGPACTDALEAAIEVVEDGGKYMVYGWDGGAGHTAGLDMLRIMLRNWNNGHYSGRPLGK